MHHIAEGEERGAHALLEGTEIMVAAHGSFKVVLDDGKNVCTISLDNLSKGLIIKPSIWFKTIWFKTHSYKDYGVSLILADEEYSMDKYIYDYDEYKRLRK